MSDLEATVPTTVPKIRIVRGDERDAAGIARGLGRLARALAIGDTEALLAAIREMVPESVPPLSTRRSEEQVSIPEPQTLEVEFDRPAVASIAENVS
jgi:hypothetical protein